MAIPVEQVFLFGEAGHDPERNLTGILSFVCNTDLAAGGAILFASLLLIGLIITNWMGLAPWISLAVRLLVVSPIKALVSGAISLVNAIAAASSVGELKTMLLANMHRVLQPVISLVLGCLAPLAWFFPKDPAVMVFRLSLGVFFGVSSYGWFLLPAFQYLNGASAGLVSTSMEQDPFCLDVLRLTEGVWRTYQHQRLNWWYCVGEEAGLQMQSIIEDDWELPRRYDELVNGEIHHLHAIAFVATCALLLLVAMLASGILPMPASFWETAAGRIVDTATKVRLRGFPLTLRESHLWDRINSYEVDLAKLRGLLDSKVEELRVAKRFRDDGWSEAQRSAARRLEADNARDREHIVNLGLRDQIRQLTMQLTVAQRKQATAAAREWDLVDKNAQLERQLGNRSEQAASNPMSDGTESLRAELRVRKEQLANIEHRLATATKARDEQSRGREHLAAEYQTLAAQHEALAVQHARLHEEHEVLKTSYDVLSTMQSGETTAELEQQLQTAKENFAEFVQQRDFMFREAEENYQKIQESLRNSEERESALRQKLEQSNTILRSCKQELAEARQDAESANRFHGLASENARRLTQEIGQAKEDAVKSRRETEDLKIQIEELEGRLANNSFSQSSSSQEIPKRQTGDLGSIRHALEESQVTVSKQQSAVDDLKRKLALASQPSPQPEDALREEIAKLREALKSEKRARDEDRITWSKENRDLREQNQRLQVARSNAGAVARGGAMRKPPRP